MKRHGASLGTAVDVVTLAVLVIAGVTLLTKPRQVEAPLQSPPVAVVPPMAPLEVSDINILGTGTSGLLLIEFSDFQCPFCKRHSEQVFPQLKSEFVETGMIRYGFGHNPLTSIHPLARALAAAAICAGKQGKFWELHGRLFAAEIYSDDDIAAHAFALGLAPNSFVPCLQNSDDVDRTIDRHITLAELVGLPATPGFLLGTVDSTGRLVALRTIRGAQPVETFRTTIREVMDAERMRD